MKSMELTIVGINPADHASWNGAEILSRITITGETMHIHTVLPPLDRPLVERLLPEFAKLEPKLSSQSRKIMEFLLDTDEGWATHEDMCDAIWATSKKSPDDTDEHALHPAISRLNTKLKSLNFGYIVESRNHICCLVPDQR